MVKLFRLRDRTALKSRTYNALLRVGSVIHTKKVRFSESVCALMHVLFVVIPEKRRDATVGVY